MWVCNVSTVIMLQYWSCKNHYYKLLTNKYYIHMNPKTKYTIYHFLLKKKYRLYNGEFFFWHNANNIKFINKPFNDFIITKKPKSYPLKVIKN